MLFTQTKITQHQINAIWKQSMKRFLQLPQFTNDWFLQLIQGSYLDIAIEKQWETSIKCQFRHGEEEQIMDIKKRKKETY
ncbi:unnamed protein product [Paramecium pentaurelia]|uniref:Uncharacterized protein n=1 Tax=Paramecium pentaurelia TaxID=43138 RepID=A0A8S1XBP2_9CILI|nr:unnamed protein product [Paramecium pentaurelia]